MGAPEEGPGKEAAGGKVMDKVDVELGAVNNKLPAREGSKIKVSMLGSLNNPGVPDPPILLWMPRFITHRGQRSRLQLYAAN